MKRYVISLFTFAFVTFAAASQASQVVGLEGMDYTLNASSLSPLPPHASTGFQWNQYDNTTADWRPQGITSVKVGERLFIVTSWYSRKQGVQSEGGRLLIADVTDPSSVTYQRVLLVDTLNKPFIAMKAGGVAYVPNEVIDLAEIHAACAFCMDSEGVRRSQAVIRFSLKDIQEVLPADQADYYGHRYIVREKSAYSVAPMHPNFIMYDWSRSQLLVGSFQFCHSPHDDSTTCTTSNPEGRVHAWYDPSQPQGMQVREGFFSETQGSASDGNIFLSNSSWGGGNLSHLHTGYYSHESAASPKLSHFRAIEYQPGVEDMHITETRDAFWMLSEFRPGWVKASNNRQVWSVPLNRRVMPDFSVNAVSAGQQRFPDTDMNSAGRSVTVWEDDRDGDGRYQVYARILGVDGNAIGSDIPVTHSNYFYSATAALGQHLRPKVAMDDDGDFVVVWQDDSDGNGIYQIHARGFHSDATPSFARKTVNTVAAGQQQVPDIGMNSATGDFFIVWQDDNDGNNFYQIYGRGFNASGAETISQLTINSIPDGQQLLPAVTVSETGQIVAVWQDDHDGDAFYSILGRGFSADGQESISQFIVSDGGLVQRGWPTIASASDGRFVVGWEADTNLNQKKDIYLRLFSSDGQALFQEFPEHRVNTNPNGQHLRPSVAMSPSGAFSAAWQDDSDGNGSFQIHASAYAKSALVRKRGFVVNQYASGQQYTPSVTMDGKDELFFVWADDKDQNDFYQIHGKFIDF